MRVHQKTKTAGALLAAALLAATATGCEDGSDKAADGARPPGAGAAQVSPAVALERAGKKSKDITSLRYTLNATSAEGKATGEVRLLLKPQPAMAMKMATVGKESGEFEMRMIDGALFLSGGEQAAAEMGGKKWIKLDMKSMAAKNATTTKKLGGLSSQGEQNPADQANQLSIAKDLKRVGPESIGGTPTTHYAGTVTLDQMRASLAGSDAETKKSREKSLKQYEQLGLNSLTMDMWIAADDTTRQFRVRGKGTDGPVDSLVTFLDFNKPVSVTAPPAAEVMDLAAMMKGLGKG